MVRRLWITVLSSVFLLSLPLGGVTAQTTPVDSPVPTLAGFVAPADGGKLTFRLQQLANAPQLMRASAQALSTAIGLPAVGAGSLMQDAQGHILVDIRLADTSAATLAALGGAGAQIVNVSPQYQVVTALVAATDLNAVAQIGAVNNVMEELTPIHGSELSGSQPALGAPADVAAPVSTCPVGTAVSHGDVQLRANLARLAHGVDGSGVKVGILSDSFDKDAGAGTHAADDVASGDLPGAGNTCGYTTPVHVISETLATGQATDEGRAMEQIVHDLAPGAQLGFASAHNGVFQFGDNIRALRTWGASVIADDEFYFVEPFFQEGPVAVAISDVTQLGAVYLTAAGNDNATIGGHEVASYETAAYRPSPVPSYLSGFGLKSCHDFNPGAPVDPTYGITFAAHGGTLLDLQWDQPWYGVTTDFDVIVTNAADTLLYGYSHFKNAGPGSTQTPFEIVNFGNSGSSPLSFHIHVCRKTSAGGDTQTPRLKWVLIEPFGATAVEYPTSGGGDIVGPAIIGHSASLYAMSVAAAPYNDSNDPEAYSSPGPATHFFGPVVNSLPAAAITPIVLHQPNFTATDGGCTTFFAQFAAGCWRFFGTSAAAPHAAAVAALIKQTSVETPTLAFNQGNIDHLLRVSAAFMSGGTVNDVGSGLVDALAALNLQLSYTHRLFLPLAR